jgi:ATP-dependent Clp protease adapter protein ClpS
MPTTTAPVRAPRTETTEEGRTTPPWQVILHDDDVTTQEFVVWLLATLFAKPATEATRLMLLVHHTAPWSPRRSRSDPLRGRGTVRPRRTP